MADVIGKRFWHPFQIVPVSEDKVLVNRGLIIDDWNDTIFEVPTYINFETGEIPFLVDLNMAPGEIIDISGDSGDPDVSIGTIIKVEIFYTDRSETEGFARITADQFEEGGIDESKGAGLLVVGLVSNTMSRLVATIDVGTVTWTNGKPVIDQRLKSDIHCSIPGTKEGTVADG
jgi:hypothetical protein